MNNRTLIVAALAGFLLPSISEAGDLPELLLHRGELVTAATQSVVWSIGVLECGQPIGVYLVSSSGVPRWIPIALATAETAGTVRRLTAAGQAHAVDVCKEGV